MKRALVVGNGVSGKAAKKLLEEHGYDVLICTTRDIDEYQSFEKVILSPGIDPKDKSLKRFHEKGNIISEVELAFSYSNCKIIGVTGTNGKSSLVTFLSHMFNCKVCGNIGVAASSILPILNEDEFVIMELSSFQLEYTYSKKLHCAILLNITPDHMDRYKDFQAYKDAKMKIKDLVSPSGYFFKEEKSNQAPFFPFSGSVMKIVQDVKEKIGGDIDIAKRSFQSLDHRLEFVCKKDGVCFINDSKATNPEATAHAVASTKGDVVLLVGGLDKSADFSIWNAAFDNKVKAIICFGSAKDKIKKILHSNFIVYTVIKMEDAVDISCNISTNGDTVLLSPGCASFDQFANYMQRGEVFKKEVVK